MRLVGAFAISLALSLLAAGVSLAQQPSHEHGATSQPRPGSAPKPGAPARADAAHEMQRMEMCRQMLAGQPGPMGGGMGAGMMGGGMMGGGMMGRGMLGMAPMMLGGDPKQDAEMMAMRGEMLKAMGDIILKYAERMRPAQ